MSAEKMVTEVCPACGSENTIFWDVNNTGYWAYCPHCGTPMLLCGECGGRCDWKDGQCRHGIPVGMTPPAAKTQKIWGHVGVMLRLTEQEYQTLCAAGDDAKEMVFQKMRSGSFLLDGETWFPQTEDEKKDCWPLEGDINLYL